jgi:hypothetical protein
MDNRVQELIRLTGDYADMLTAYQSGETDEENYDHFCDWYADQLARVEVEKEPKA